MTRLKPELDPLKWSGPEREEARDGAFREIAKRLGYEITKIKGVWHYINDTGSCKEFKVPHYLLFNPYSDPAWIGPLLEKLWELEPECHPKQGLEKEPMYYVYKDYAFMPCAEISRGPNLNTALILAIQTVWRKGENV